MAYTMKFLFVVLQCFIILTVIVHGERTKDKMYEKIDGAAACFRRLNATHQFGCSSQRNGNTGVLHVVFEREDLDWLLKSGSADPYMVVLQPDLFTREVLVSLRDSGKASGVVLAVNATAPRPPRYSPEDTCPDRYSGLAAGGGGGGTCDPERPWNPAGSALLLEDWGFPLFHVADPDVVDKIHECYAKHNADRRDAQESRSLCALEMKAYMFAAVDSRTCIRRSNIMTNLNPIRYCDPLGDHNVWYTLFARPNTTSAEGGGATPRNESLIVVAARLDATSMFDGVVPGAATPTAGLVALLVTAQMLAAMLPPAAADTASSNVLFALLHGESYDYIGSSRAVYDMGRGEFPAAPDPTLAEQPAPIRLSDVGLVVELSQLSRTRPLYIHRSDHARPKAEEFIRELTTVGQDFNLVFEQNNNVPPSSLQTFLREDPGLPGVVVTDHGDQYVNKYYHSIFDDGSALDYAYANGTVVAPDSVQAAVGNLSAALAKTLYKMVTDREYTGQYAAANLTLVDELFHCYLDTTNCSLFHAATSHKQALVDRPAQHYVGVSVHPNSVALLTGLALALLTGEKMAGVGEGDCSDPANSTLYQHLWMSAYSSNEGNDTGVCVRTTMAYTLAVSPAFVIDDYDWLSGNYSTWTESIWSELSVRMFLKPSRAQEAITFCAGAVVLVAAFVVVYFASLKADTLFRGNVPLAAAC